MESIVTPPSCVSQRKSTFTSFPFSSLSTQSSCSTYDDPSTHRRPPPEAPETAPERALSPLQSAQTGRLSGKASGPEESTGKAGFCTASEQPYGYTNDKLA